MTKRAASMAAVVALSWIMLSAPASHAGEINTGYFGNVAIEGYDPVAYFREGRARKGDPAYSYEWFGAEWHFSTPENRLIFEEDPIAFTPQYGGLCADGVAYGAVTANIDPELFSIIDGKLYLSYDPEAKREIEEIAGQLGRAEENWPEVQKRFVGN